MVSHERGISAKNLTEEDGEFKLTDKNQELYRRANNEKFYFQTRDQQLSMIGLFHERSIARSTATALALVSDFPKLACTFAQEGEKDWTAEISNSQLSRQDILVAKWQAKCKMG